MATSIELRQERAKLIAENRAILEKAEKESRGLNTEETTEYEKRDAEVDALLARVERIEKQDQRDADIAATRDSDIESDSRADAKPEKSEYRTSRGTPEYREAFAKFLAGGLRNMSEAETRALQADSDTAGGYTYGSEQFAAQLIKFVDNAVAIRGLANVMTVTNADSLGFPSLDADPADAAWTTELQTGDEDSTMAFGKRALTPHPLAKRIKVSKTLLRKSAIPVEQLVMERLGYKFAVTQEQAFMTGSGSSQPLGVFTASANGISTSRDVSTGNASTAMTVDGIMEAAYTLKPQYWGAARWIFHRDGVKQLRKLKDGEGRYLIDPAIKSGSIDALVNMPVIMSEYAPSTFTTGQYVGILGDFSKYWIADALSLQMQRLDELYAETNQVGFIGRLETDGMPVLEEAFIRVKLG